MIELLSEKSLDQISVNNLTKLAGLNRGTFYLHYRSISDMMEKITGEIVDELNAAIADCDKGDIDDVAYNITLCIFNFFNEGRDLYTKLFSDRGDQKFVNTVGSSLRKYTFMAFRDNGLSEFKNGMGAAFVSGGVASAVSEWLVTESTATPEEMAKLLSEIILGKYDFFHKEDSSRI
ncbi:MAG: TetR/AcrR family transcriptional regulator [Coriobacteriales bacterium]